MGKTIQPRRQKKEGLENIPALLSSALPVLNRPQPRYNCRPVARAFLFAAFFSFLLPQQELAAQQNSESALTLARVKYRGGGDWYNDPSCLPNLLAFMKQNTSMTLGANEAQVELNDPALFSYPILFLTGHGRITFSPEEAQHLRHYLTSGGFLYADDDYGMDKFFRDEMKKAFPDKQWVELPFNHAIYHNAFEFPNGVPKTHEHDGGAPKAYGLFHEGRMIAYYTWNTNISDGWADPEVHHDPPEVRTQALQMGANIVVYALMN